MTNLQFVRDILEIASYVVIVLGIPAGLVQYIINKRKERETQEYETYHALDERFMDYQLLCLQNPQLDVFDIPEERPVSINQLEKKKELIIFTVLFSIFERAYLMYKDQPSELKKRQWIGWHSYIESFCKRENFRNAWEKSGSMFDDEFQSYMDFMVRQSVSKEAIKEMTQ